jgi:hypothetical protein
MKIACVTSARSLGGTFVDWSLHFLSNRSDYYRVAEQSSIPLVSTPLTSINSHNHRKNHPSGATKTTQYIQHFQNQQLSNFCSMYPIPMYIDIAVKHLDITQSQLGDVAIWKKVNQYIVDDYQILLNQCCVPGISTIYIDPDPNLNLYFLSIRSLERIMFGNRPAVDQSESIEEFQNTFFQSSIAQWQRLNLTDSWDVRERMALDTQPFDRFEDHLQLNFSQPHLWINSAELWNYGTNTIKVIMEYLELPVHLDRWHQWLPIHEQWHTMQQQQLKFAYQFEHIIDAIVNNYYYKLEKLSFLQEVAIQNALIYRHDLNLKTWQLHQFPSNTKDLHKLLEPNIHIR